MATRIDLELTSSRDDGTWTWRAAGAKQPKGVVDASLLPDGSKVGDVLKADADYLMGDIEILSVQARKGPRGAKAETLEILGSGKKEELVTTKLYKGSKGRGGRDGGRGRDGGGGRGRDGGRGGRDGGGRGRDGGGRDGGRGRGDNRRQQAPRLRPANVHRQAWIESCSDVQRPIAEQLMEGGVPSVRSAIQRQNENAKAEGKPEINGNALLAMAESLAPGLKTAEWRDRAEAAIAGADKLDIRDLRSVVASAEAGARDPESRGMADTLRTKISSRVDREHAAWLADIQTAITDGRVVRALRSSARPAKPGTPMPKELAEKLVTAAGEALSEEEEPSRWATVLDAVAFSPVREFVTPAGVPDLEDRELVSAVKKLSNRVPQIAALFGIEPKPETRRARGGKGKGKGSQSSDKASSDQDAADKSTSGKRSNSVAVETPSAKTQDAPGEVALDDAAHARDEAPTEGAAAPETAAETTQASPESPDAQDVPTAATAPPETAEASAEGE